MSAAPDPGPATALDDPDQLAALINRHGVTGAARQIGCSPSTLRARARQHGIAPQPSGRRRGRVTLAPSVRQRGELSDLERRLIDRVRHLTGRVAPDETAIAGAIRRAQAEHTAHGYDAALLDTAATIAVVVAHRQQHREAA